LDAPQSGAGDWQLACLASWGQPAAQLLQISHQGLLLNDHCYLSVAICCCLGTTKTNAASSEGGRGWSVARAATIITSKTLARFRALAQNQARRGGWKLKVFMMHLSLLLRAATSWLVARLAASPEQHHLWGSLGVELQFVLHFLWGGQ